MADDDDDDLELMKSAFEEEGFPSPLQGFNDGLALLDHLVQQLPEKKPTLIVLDLNMPKNSGKAILKKIRQIVALNNVSVIIYSTSSANNDIIESYESGCNAYIIKPNCYKEIKKIARGIKQLWFDTGNILKFNV